jgi:hypothetical protein
VDTGWWVGLGGVLVGVIGALAAWAKAMRGESRQDVQAQVVALQQVVADVRAQAARQQAYVTEQQATIDKLWRAYSDLRDDATEYYGLARSFREHALHLAEAVERLGESPGEVAGLEPRRRPLLSAEDAEFLRRTAAQRTQLLHEAARGVGLAGNTDGGRS